MVQDARNPTSSVGAIPERSGASLERVAARPCVCLLFEKQCFCKTMLLFVSDLHLVDLSECSTLNTPAFLQRIKQVLKDSAQLGVTNAKLVLLGDIFELLKS
jgi:hypothetical protein